MTRRPVGIATAVVLAIATGCASASAGLTDDELEGLLDRLRGAPEGRFQQGWLAEGRGRMLDTRGTARLLADGAGRYRFQLDGPVPYAEVHDGAATSQLLPWGRVTDLIGGAEELSLVPMWVITGHWLAPTAPVEISAGPVDRSTNVATLYVRHRRGHVPFEVSVDIARAAPLRVRTGGATLVDFELEEHRRVAGRPVPSVVRSVKNGKTLAELRFGAARPLPPGSADWSRPRPVAIARFERDASPVVAARNDGRGYLFARPLINGRRMGWFLVDTGAPATMIGLAAARTLELTRLGEGESTGVGGAAEIGFHPVESIRLGPLEVGPSVVASLDVLRLGWSDLPIAGILGCDVLGRAVVEYEVATNSIELHDPTTYALPNGVRWVPIGLNEGKPIVRVPFEDHEGEFLVDTAAGGSFSIGRHLVERLGLLDGRRTSGSRSHGVGGTVGVRNGSVRWLEFGGRRYEEVTTQFAVSDRGSYAQAYPDGIVGIGLIDDHRVVFDLDNARIAFLPRTR